MSYKYKHIFIASCHMPYIVGSYHPPTAPSAPRHWQVEAKYDMQARVGLPCRIARLLIIALSQRDNSCKKKKKKNPKKKQKKQNKTKQKKTKKTTTTTKKKQQKTKHTPIQIYWNYHHIHKKKKPWKFSDKNSNIFHISALNKTPRQSRGKLGALIC